MFDERDALVKRVFPQLRRLCDRRGVVWGEVDLRWGVTDEQKAEGKVLPICLEEINRCRPYFIGLLGERYGSLAREISGELIEREPWLKEHLQHSLTELEIWHGVLRNPAMAGRALFYFRDPAYFTRLPKGQDPANYVPESEETQARLAALKARIRESGLPVRENYTDPKALGELVLDDLNRIIDELFPEGSQPDPLDRDAADHESFARSRARVYVGCESNFRRLDEHASGTGPPLIVLGESGSGKSALLANWALKYLSEHPGNLVVMHFIGATPYSSDWTAMLRRIMGELKRRFGIEGEMPDQPDALRQAFADLLNTASIKGRVIIIFDALNQLEDRDAAPDLVWLPPVIPGNIRIFLSTLPGRPLEEIWKRGWPTLEVRPLAREERVRFIKDYLALYAKSLDPGRIERISRAEQAGNPLFLRALLDELRLFGIHERLNERIDLYLAAPTISALYELILTRYEEDYEVDRPDLVRDTMTTIWAARRGLSEAELFDKLRRDRDLLPRAYWSPLFIAAESALTARSGFLGFFHDHFREAIRHRYLPTTEEQNYAHFSLALYFAKLEPRPRIYDELPWQLAAAESWDNLYRVLTDPLWFEAIWSANPFDLKAYWARMETGSEYRLTDAYRSSLSRPEDVPDKSHLEHLGALLADTGHPEEALFLFRFLSDHYFAIGDHQHYLCSLGWQAAIYFSRGDLDEAMALYKKEEQACRKIEDTDAFHSALLGQANISYIRGEADAAITFFQEAEKTYRQAGNKGGLQFVLANLSVVLQGRGDWDGALAGIEQAERICREINDTEGLQNALLQKANIRYRRGDLSGAYTLCQEAEHICRDLGNKNGLSQCLNGRALIFADLGDLDSAMALAKETERINREIGNKRGLARSLGNQAVLLWKRGNSGDAMALYQEEERIYRDLGDQDGLSNSLGNKANLRYSIDDLDGALALYKEQERINRKLGRQDGLAASLCGQANILYRRADTDGAMALYKEQESICRDLGDKQSLAIALGNQTLILKDRGDIEGALALLMEQGRLYRELGIKDALQASLGELAKILESRGDPEAAMSPLKEKERICRELKNKNGLYDSISGQADNLYSRGKQVEAVALYKEAESLCRELDKKDGLQVSLSRQADGLYLVGRLDEAMALYQEQARICEETKNTLGLSISLGNQALILEARGDLDRAMALNKEKERLCREIHNHDGLQQSLGRQAAILRRRGRWKKAMVLYKEQERLARETGGSDGLLDSLGGQAALLSNRGDLDQALTFYKEQEQLCRERKNPAQLAANLGNQGLVLMKKGLRNEALALIEEAHKISVCHGLSDIIKQIQPLMDRIKAE